MSRRLNVIVRNADILEMEGRVGNVDGTHTSFLFARQDLSLIEKIDFERVQHPSASDSDPLRLSFHW